ncbi:RBBP9/YdeN family alpha/beta hydrolase [Nocardioides terrae]|nr:alpha/beta fold hydrolase [Nocardioides terrae]
MSRNAIIFHGTGARPEYLWYQWLAMRLEARGYTVSLPHLPGINVEPIDAFLPRALEAHAYDEDTVVVGHSGGAALILALLERLDVTVAQVVLVAGYSTPPNDNEEPVLRPAYDWDAIRSHARDLWFVNSVVDPYGCDAAQGRVLLDRLGGTLVVRPEGHFEVATLDLVDRIVG